MGHDPENGDEVSIYLYTQYVLALPLALHGDAAYLWAAFAFVTYT